MTVEIWENIYSVLLRLVNYIKRYQQPALSGQVAEISIV